MSDSAIMHSPTSQIEWRTWSYCDSEPEPVLVEGSQTDLTHGFVDKSLDQGSGFGIFAIHTVSQPVTVAFFA
jgi:hypothetical protein